MTTVALVLAAWRTARDLVALSVGIGALVLVASYCAGCAGGVAGAAVAAKPILDTTCAGARVACRLIDSACSAYEDATAPLTSGGDNAEETP